jgi:hypothetical protein
VMILMGIESAMIWSRWGKQISSLSYRTFPPQNWHWGPCHPS